MRAEEICQKLRNRIISGEFSETGTLPRRHILLHEYNASNMTVQRVINQLMKEGFLISRGSKGISLSPAPPNRYRYALVIPPTDRREEIQNDTRWDAMENAVELYQTEHPAYSFVYYTIHESGRLQPNYLRLLDDLKKGLLAGVILTYALYSDLIAGLQDYPVVIHEPKDPSINGIKYQYDWISMVKCAIERLKTLQKRKIAVILFALMDLNVEKQIRKLLLESNLRTCPEWIQGTILRTQEDPWPERLIELLYKPEMPETPDGLIVLNENFLPSIVGVLKRRKIRLGTDVHVISHCNIPTNKSLLKNIDYISFNFTTLLDDSIKTLELIRKGENVSENNYSLPECVFPLRQERNEKNVKNKEIQP